MRLAVAALAALSTSMTSAATPQSAAATTKPAEVLISDVSVFSPETGSWLEHRDIVVRDTRIFSVSAHATSSVAAKHVVRGTGKFAVPGLFDNRVHIAGLARDAAPLFLAFGVTTVGDVRSDADRVSEWRRAINNGKLHGPRIVAGVAAPDRAQPRPLPGSQAGQMPVSPGSSLIEKLESLVRDAGVSTADALAAATLRSAEVHGLSGSLGSIEAGKTADIVILDRNPLADISNLRSIDAVVFRGEMLTRAHLNQFLSAPRSR
jgi:imidazolonepropionase-like amidohydrolase